MQTMHRYMHAYIHYTHTRIHTLHYVHHMQYMHYKHYIYDIHACVYIYIYILIFHMYIYRMHASVTRIRQNTINTIHKLHTHTCMHACMHTSHMYMHDNMSLHTYIARMHETHICKRTYITNIRCMSYLHHVHDIHALCRCITRTHALHTYKHALNHTYNT